MLGYGSGSKGHTASADGGVLKGVEKPQGFWLIFLETENAVSSFCFGRFSS